VPGSHQNCKWLAGETQPLARKQTQRQARQHNPAQTLGRRTHQAAGLQPPPRRARRRSESRERKGGPRSGSGSNLEATVRIASDRW